MAWVYPSFHRKNCFPAYLPAPRLTVWQCNETTPSGDSVLIRYTEWANTDAGWASYTSKNRARTLELVRSEGGRVARGVFRYEGVNREGRVTMSSMYRHWPFSVSVESYSKRAVEDAFRGLVEQRDVRQMKGVLSGG